MEIAFIIFQIIFIVFIISAIRKIFERNKRMREAGILSVGSGYYIITTLSIILGLLFWWIVVSYTQNQTAGFIAASLVIISGILYAKKSYTVVSK
jgi:hypothetical protein